MSHRRSIIASLCLAIAMSVLHLFGQASASAAEQPASPPAPVPVPLPSPRFEESKPETPNAALQPMETPEGKVDPSTPVGWSAYQWGLKNKRYAVAVDKGAGRSGSALRAHNIDPEARAGAYTHVQLKPGTYRLSVWARAAAGRTSDACIYLANRQSLPVRLTDQWRQIVLTTVVPEAMARAEVSLQNCSKQTDDIWFDDVELVQLGTATLTIVPDTRPERPRTLLFSPINATYLRENASEWARRGFRGFLFDWVMHDNTSDVWASDGDPKTRGEDDILLREIKACNEACRAVGIDSNFVKVAFHTLLPNPFDDEAWLRLTSNFAEAATFAKLSGCAGVAIDTEYVAPQYNPLWPGYADSKRTAEELGQKYRERFVTLTRQMLERYPDMVLLTLPEGIRLYKAFYRSVFEGMLQGCADADAPGGLHLLTEETYHLTGPVVLANYAEDLNNLILQTVNTKLQNYWKRRCTIALGAWPLGYYRPILDETGKQIGYGGRKEIYGDKVIGSYADRSAWYPPETFRQQMAGLNTFSPRYNWIYAHGPVFWSLTPEELARYKKGPHRAMGDTLPTVTNLADYFDAIARPGLAQWAGSTAASQPAPTTSTSAVPPSAPSADQERRQRLLAKLEPVVGPLPSEARRVPLDVKVLETVTLPKAVRKKISFVPEKGDLIHAYLFIPVGLTDKAPAMLCLHQTFAGGKDEPAGLAGSSNMHYGLELSERGYVTLAPDITPFGQRKVDPYALGYESVTMKCVWDHMRAVDLLTSLPEVNGQAIGSIGHSHGGFSTLMLAAYDPRIKVAVSSCGFSSFHDYNGGNLAGWSQRIYYMPRIASAYGNSPARVPFDFPDVLAAIAPRPLLISTAMKDPLFKVESVNRCVDRVRPVYQQLKAPGNLSLIYAPGDHDFPQAQRERAYQFIDKALRPAR